MIYIAIFIASYLLGSIPFGLILCKIFGYGDIRKIGSGNIGATNVLRTGNKFLAVMTLLLDCGKGAIAVLLIGMFFSANCHLINCVEPCSCTSFEEAMFFKMLAGFSAILGHCYPIWLKFKGGKGVATTMGTLLAAVPVVGGAACLVWFLMALIFRISSLAALIAIGLTPIIAQALYNDFNISGLCAAIAVIVYIKHHENIKRLFAGQEPKIGKKK